MPQLKHLTCSVEWVPEATPFQEYGTVYGDGIVETYIAVPDHPQTFGIHLKSTSFIAQGLAAIVFVDGQYQCNRNRTNLKPSQNRQPSDASEISFHLRQKEKSLGDGRCLGREWRFDWHNIVPALPEEVDSSHFDQLGSIEVLVLRCMATEDSNGHRSRASSGADSHPLENATQAKLEDSKDNDASLPAYEPGNTVGTATAHDNTSPSLEDEVGGMFGGLDLAQGDGPSDGSRNPNETWGPPLGYLSQPQPFAAGQHPPYGAPGYSGWPNPHYPRTEVPHPNAQGPRFADTGFTGRNPAQDAPRQARRVHFDFGPPNAPHAHPVHGADYGHSVPRRRLSGHDQPYVPPYTGTPVEYENPPLLFSPPPAAYTQNPSVHRPRYHDYRDCHPYQHPPSTAQPPPQPAPMQYHPPTEQAEYYPALHSQVPLRWPYPADPYTPGREVLVPPPTYPSYHPCYVPTPAPYGYQVPPGYWPAPMSNTQTTMAGHPNYAERPPSGIDPAREDNNRNDTSTFDNQDLSRQEPTGGNGSINNGNQPNTADDGAQGGGGQSWDDQGNTTNENAQGGGGASWDDQDEEPIPIPNNDSWDQNQNENAPTENQNTTAWETDDNPPSRGGNWDQPPLEPVQNTGPNQTFDQPSQVPSHTAPQPRSLYGPYGPYYSLEPPALDESEVGAEEEPRYDIPRSIVEETGSKMQVQGGRGYIYMHRGCRPDYIDSIEEPYARFVFKYRTRVQLRQELGIELEVEPSGSAKVQNLQAMDKQAIIEMLLRAQSALGGGVPSPTPDVPTAAGNAATGEPRLVPVPVPAPTTSSRKYTLPTPRNVSKSGAGAGAFSSPNAAAAGQQIDTQNHQDWSNNSNNNNNRSNQQVTNNDNNNSSNQQFTNNNNTSQSNQPQPQPTRPWSNQIAPVKVLTKPTNNNQPSTPHQKRKNVWEALEAGELSGESSPEDLTAKQDWSKTSGWGGFDNRGSGGNNAGNSGNKAGGGGWEGNNNGGGGNSGVKW